jgi:Bacterial protein of unknown function (DUF937)
MATNLVSSMMQFLTPDMIGRIAGALGLNRGDAQSGVSAAVPTLLAAFTGLADKSGGAQNLVNTIRQQSGVLDNFASMIGGNNQTSFIDRGSSLLTSLIGSTDKSALAGALARSTGVGQNGVSSLLGMLTPVVMGLIGKQIGARGLDVGSLTSLLASQKEHIAQALPAGMERVLEGMGFDSFGAARPAAAEAGRATTSPGQFTQYTSPRATGTRERDTTFGIPNWAYWALPLIALGALIWYLLGRPAQQEVATQQPPAQQAPAQQTPTPPQSVIVGGIDLRREIGDSLNEVRTSLQGVTDVSSATAALPKLEEAKTQIDKVSSLVGRLTPDQRKTVAALVAPAMPTINQLSDKVLEIPGVGDVLKPTVDPMKTKLAELSGQPSTVGSGR